MKKNKALLFILIGSLVLVGCQKTSPKDNTAGYIAQIKKTVDAAVTVDTKKLLPPELPPVHFVVNKKQNPFVSPEPVAKKRDATGFLGEYNIKSLKLLGVMTLGEKTWAIMQTPDGNIIKVAKGMRIGYDQGLVTDITQDSVKLTIDTDVGKKELTITLQEPAE